MANRITNDLNHYNRFLAELLRRQQDNLNAVRAGHVEYRVCIDVSEWSAMRLAHIFEPLFSKTPVLQGLTHNVGRPYRRKEDLTRWPAQLPFYGTLPIALSGEEEVPTHCVCCFFLVS